LISTNSPQYKPSFDLNREVVQKAERFGFDFALSMIKLHGFGGPSQFWDYNLESFTPMAGLAAVTSRIRLFATCQRDQAEIKAKHRQCHQRPEAPPTAVSRGRAGRRSAAAGPLAQFVEIGALEGYCVRVRRPADADILGHLQKSRGAVTDRIRDGTKLYRKRACVGF
jgi:pyrimidine oxygenase